MKVIITFEEEIPSEINLMQGASYINSKYGITVSNIRIKNEQDFDNFNFD